MNDEWWVMEIKWRKLSDEIFLSKQPLSNLVWKQHGRNGMESVYDNIAVRSLF